MKRTGVRMVAFVVGCSAGDDVPEPLLSSITPTHAVPGVSVTIAGDYLCQQPETGDEPLACAFTGTVFFGQAPGTLGLYSDHVIIAEVPRLEPTTYPVSVSVAGRRSNSLSFTIDVR